MRSLLVMTFTWVPPTSIVSMVMRELLDFGDFDIDFRSVRSGVAHITAFTSPTNRIGIRRTHLRQSLSTPAPCARSLFGSDRTALCTLGPHRLPGGCGT